MYYKNLALVKFDKSYDLFINHVLPPMITKNLILHII